MEDEIHLEVDDLAVLVLGGMEDDARERAEAHLAGGCARCLRELAWVKQTLASARADRSEAPPPHVLARAVRIMEQAWPDTHAAPLSRRHFLARPLFAHFNGQVTPGLAGARGSGTLKRQMLYGVAELNLEIDVQVQLRRLQDARDVLDIHGQVFSLDEEVQELADLRVEVDTPGGTRQAVASPLGDFRIEAPESGSRLIMHLGDCSIEIPLP